MDVVERRGVTLVNLAAVGAAVGLLAVWAVLGDQGRMGPWLRSRDWLRYGLYAGGSLWFAVNLWATWREFAVDDAAAFVRVTNADGEVAVAVRAIELSLARNVEGLGDLHEVRVAVDRPSDPKGRLQVRASCSTWEGVNVAETYERLQALLKARWREIVPGPDVPAFDVRLVSIDRRRELTAPRGKAPPEADPYTQPRYLE
ncbi:MAG: hypothetical protein HY722_08495 [Planctomycetes bacterium]|nr:hypothetical protein [Planctomycetota bacterium]